MRSNTVRVNIGSDLTWCPIVQDSRTKIAALNAVFERPQSFFNFCQYCRLTRTIYTYKSNSDHLCWLEQITDALPVMSAQPRKRGDGVANQISQQQPPAQRLQRSGSAVVVHCSNARDQLRSCFLTCQGR